MFCAFCLTGWCAHMHACSSNISTLGSSYGDLFDIGLSFVSFHFLVFLALLQQPKWNLPSMVFLILFEVRPALVASFLLTVRV